MFKPVIGDHLFPPVSNHLTHDPFSPGANNVEWLCTYCYILVLSCQSQTDELSIYKKI